MKHLFFEGPMKEGKSTYIRQLIKDKLNLCGGFASQRLLDEEGAIVGYRVVPAKEALEIERVYTPDLDNVFRLFKENCTVNAPEVFYEGCMNYLRDQEGKQFMLLDEIGGMELLVPQFRKALDEILGGGLPCIGVIKSHENVRHMCRRSPDAERCIALNDALHQEIKENFGGEIISFVRGEDYRCQVEAWLGQGEQGVTLKA
ncbi:MAG: nucleoside-triphosphatase, partial [Anaerovoracaceae bacterium]